MFSQCDSGYSDSLLDGRLNPSPLSRCEQFPTNPKSLEMKSYSEPPLRDRGNSYMTFHLSEPDSSISRQLGSTSHHLCLFTLNQVALAESHSSVSFPTACHYCGTDRGMMIHIIMVRSVWGFFFNSDFSIKVVYEFPSLFQICHFFPNNVRQFYFQMKIKSNQIK